MTDSIHTPGKGDLVARVRWALRDVPAVKEKKMFGSTAFMVRGKMCITARAERIMCRIEPALHAAAIARDGCQTVMMRGRPYRGFVHVAAENLRTARALTYWIALALRFNAETSVMAGKNASKRTGRKAAT
jgi:hypothetical protein